MKSSTKFSKTGGIICLTVLLFVCNFKANALTITSNTTWTTNQTISGDLIIENNATLTISGTSAIVTVSGNVDVKPGSWLFVNNSGILKTGDKIILESPNSLSGTAARLWVETGGTLTAANNEWEGVEVWGDILNFGPGLHSARAQATFLNATVEKAEIGVATYQRTSGGAISYKGGIVSAINTVFKNNRISVSIKENLNNFVTSTNNNYITSVPTNNPSVLRECQFLETTIDNPFYPNSMGNRIVEVYDAKGINILGCNFDNEITNIAISGIVSYNSDIRVGPTFSPSYWWGYYIQLPNPTTFKNMWMGIFATGPGTFNRILSQQSDINNSEYGIYLSDEQNGILIYNNIHNLGQTFNTPQGIDILYGSSGFTVEGNSINGTNNEVNGIFVQNTGEENNEIYRNIISNYGTGIVANGINGLPYTPGNYTSQGLKLFCNQLQNNSYSNSIGIFVNGDIAFKQGIPISINPNNYHYIAAGNLFPSLSLHDPQLVRTSSSAPFLYYLYFSNTAEIPGSPGLINFSDTWSDIDNTCPVRQFPIITPHIYTVHLQSVENQIADLNQKDSLSSSDSTHIAALWDWHQGLIDSMLYTFMYSDSVEVRYDSMAWALEQVHYGYYNQVKLAGIYLTQLRYSDAINLLSDIPTEYVLTDSQAQDISNLKAMYAVIDSLAQNGDNWDTLSDYLKQEVNNVAGSSGIYGPAVAIYLLERYEGYFYEPALPQQDQTQSMHFYSSKKSKIYPNPTDGTLYINWVSKENISVIAYNLQGRVVLKKSLNSGLNTVSINALPLGVYLFHIYENDKSVYQQKIIKK